MVFALNDVKGEIGEFFRVRFLVRSQTTENKSAANITRISVGIMSHVHSDSRMALITEMQINLRETIPWQFFTDDLEKAEGLC